MKRIPTASAVWITLGMSGLSPALAQELRIDWFTLDGGGGSASAGAAYQLEGTIGQPDAGPEPAGSGFVLTGGFWVVASGGCLGSVAADFDGDCDVDQADLFVFEDCCVFGPGVPHPAIPLCGQADLDRDGDVDQSDFGRFQACYSGEGRAVDIRCTE